MTFVCVYFKTFGGEGIIAGEHVGSLYDLYLFIFHVVGQGGELEPCQEGCALCASQLVLPLAAQPLTPV